MSEMPLERILHQVEALLINFKYISPVHRRQQLKRLSFAQRQRTNQFIDNTVRRIADWTRFSRFSSSVDFFRWVAVGCRASPSRRDRAGRRFREPLLAGCWCKHIGQHIWIWMSFKYFVSFEIIRLSYCCAGSKKWNEMIGKSTQTRLETILQGTSR